MSGLEDKKLLIKDYLETEKMDSLKSLLQDLSEIEVLEVMRELASED